MPSPNLGMELVGDFTHDAARDLHELSHVVAEILGLLVGELEQLLEQLHEHRRAHDHLRLVLDAVGVEIIFCARHAPAAPNRGRSSPPSQDAPGAKIGAGVGPQRSNAHATVIGDLAGVLAALHPFGRDCLDMSDRLHVAICGTWLSP
jgi:hypothetical protein